MHNTEAELRHALRVMHEQLTGKNADSLPVTIIPSDDLSVMITKALELPEVPETQLVSREPRNDLGTYYVLFPSDGDDPRLFECTQDMEQHLNEEHSEPDIEFHAYKITGSRQLMLERTWRVRD